MTFSAGEILTAADLNAALTAIPVGLLLNQASIATVSTSETTSSTSYTALATVGPAVTVVSTGTRALVIFGCNAFSNSATVVGHYASVVVSGATTRAANDDISWRGTASNAGAGFRSFSVALLTINAGSNTYTMQYKLSAATASTFSARSIIVIAP